MMFEAILTQAEIANWVSAISTSAATIVALGLAVWEIRRTAAERRDRAVGLARLVTIEVDDRQDVAASGPWIDITNQSDQPVYQPRVVYIGNVGMTVRWGKERYVEYSQIEVLPARERHRVPFGYFDSEGAAIDIRYIGRGVIEQWIEPKDVVITFTDAAGLRWRRTGHSEPVRGL